MKTKTPKRAALERGWKLLEEVAAAVGSRDPLDAHIPEAVRKRDGSFQEARRLREENARMESAIRAFLGVRDEKLTAGAVDFADQLEGWRVRHDKAVKALASFVEVPF